MVENSRAHERIPQRELPGIRATFNGPLDKSVHVFIPEAARRAKSVRLVLHFHGAPFIAEHAVTEAGRNYVSAVIQLGAGNGVYDVNFSAPAAFDSLVSNVRRTLAGQLARDVAIERIILSGFSAGHGAIRAILRDSVHFAEVDAVLLLDGFHTGYEPPGTVVDKGGRLNPVNLAEITRFARTAAAGDKRLLMTHSEIFPGTFASTTETANYVLEQLQLRRRPVLEWGPLGMQQTSEARRGGFLVMGFAGNSAPDHIDHFHGMYHFLRLLERL
jgi:type IV secretory pathway VirB2 component (pilin)